MSHICIEYENNAKNGIIYRKTYNFLAGVCVCVLCNGYMCFCDQQTYKLACKLRFHVPFDCLNATFSFTTSFIQRYSIYFFLCQYMKCGSILFCCCFVLYHWGGPYWAIKIHTFHVVTIIAMYVPWAKRGKPEFELAKLFFIASDIICCLPKFFMHHHLHDVEHVELFNGILREFR